MGVHYIIHDLHPTLQSDHLDGKDFRVYIYKSTSLLSKLLKNLQVTNIQ